MSTERQLIELLADGKRHSGADLATALGISRAAVWKAVQRAADRFGIEVIAVKGHGYQLPAPLELLDPELIQTLLPAAASQRIDHIAYFDDIPSTNTWLLEHGKTAAGRGAVALAERQTAGRGRRGRPWVSPFAANLYLSILWYFDSGPGALGALSLAAGAAVVQALKSFGVADIHLKWPNDIHWQYRKLGGLLVEVAGETQGPSRVVIGLGLNLRMPAAPGNGIDQPWVDLHEICQGQPPRRNQLVAQCIDGITDMLAQFAQVGSAPFLDAWKRLDGYLGQSVTLSWGQHSLSGICRGIDQQGMLRLEIDGNIQTFAAGELSLRGNNPRPIPARLESNRTTRCNS